MFHPERAFPVGRAELQWINGVTALGDQPFVELIAQFPVNLLQVKPRTVRINQERWDDDAWLFARVGEKHFRPGDVPPQKWMNFYTKVLSKFASARGLKLTVKVEASPEGGVSKQKLEETKSALRELGLNDDVSARLI